jgi:FtsZ-interacting cell division protein YlmF
MQKEKESKTSAEKIYYPERTQAERSMDRLQAMRKQADKKTGSSRRAKVEGKQKSSKLTFIQLKALEQLAVKDERLKGSQVVRIALNRMLGLENSAEENELESRIQEILRQIKSQS